MSAADMQASALQACRFLKTLANPDRLLLLCQLAEGEKCVGELEAASGIQQPTLSQQLGVLRAEALVSARREGKFIYYALSSTEAVEVMAVLHRLFCKAAPAPRGSRPRAKAGAVH